MEDQPFTHQAMIVLHGHVRSQELPMYGTKMLAVREGTLDLHGSLSQMIHSNILYQIY